MIGADGEAEMRIALLPHPRGCSDEKSRSNAASVNLAGMRKAKSVERGCSAVRRANAIDAPEAFRTFSPRTRMNKSPPSRVAYTHRVLIYVLQYKE